MKRVGRYLLVPAPPHSGGCRQGTYKVFVRKSRARVQSLPARLANSRPKHGRTSVCEAIMALSPAVHRVLSRVLNNAELTEWFPRKSQEPGRLCLWDSALS